MIPQNPNVATVGVPHVPPPEAEPPSLVTVKALGIVGELVCFAALVALIMSKDTEGIQRLYMDGEGNPTVAGESCMWIMMQMDAQNDVFGERDPEVQLQMLKVLLLIIPCFCAICNLFAMSCCVGCACCCGIGEYTRLKVAMVLLLGRTIGIILFTGFTDPTLYYAVLLPIFFFVQHGWARADEYEKPDAHKAGPRVIIVMQQLQPYPAPQPHGWNRDYTDDQDYPFFKLHVANAVANLKSQGHTCSDAAVAKATMFIVRKWQHHREIFKCDTLEAFWDKNESGILVRIAPPNQNNIELS